jgi:actin cytoskeleton-regulatory complex protein PAN1
VLLLNLLFPYFFAVSAKGLYGYPGGGADELPFSEGDIISVVDRSDRDWYKAEKDGVIFIVPAAYLEIEG